MEQMNGDDRQLTGCRFEYIEYSGGKYFYFCLKFRQMQHRPHPQEQCSSALKLRFKKTHQKYGKRKTETGLTNIQQARPFKAGSVLDCHVFRSGRFEV